VFSLPFSVFSVLKRLVVVRLRFKRCVVSRDVERIFAARMRGGAEAEESGGPVAREETPFDIS
jgi:hypothetical protein